jgi:glutaryl-CoA dehydrogenase (non-decarboxylating)
MYNYEIHLSEEHKILRQTVRDFAEKEILPRVEEDEINHRFQRDIINKMADLGFFGCAFPEKYGGSEMGFLAHAIACEETAYASGPLTSPYNMQSMGTSMQILLNGTEEQKDMYISKLLKCEILGCMCITEPDAGTDTASMKATAVREGDYYILNGTKTWITYSTVADMGMVYAYTDRSKRRDGLSVFLVDMHSPGIATTELKRKLGWNSCPTGEVFLENVKVPAENLLGKEGGGFKCLMRGLNNSRLTAAARGVGASQAIVDECIKYARQRQQFGQEIGKFQMIKDQIARMVVETEAARLLVYRCAYEKDMGISNPAQTSIAKYFSGDVVARNAELGLLIFGAYGYSGEYPMERLLRESKVYQIFEGSPNIQKVIIANDVLGYAKE